MQAIFSDIEKLRKLPKAELHLHIEGTFEPELIFELAAKNRVDLNYKSVEELRQAYQFSDLQSFLNIYYAGMSVLKDEHDFEKLAESYFERAAADGVVHAELFFDPQAHTGRGIKFDTVINGLHRACKNSATKYGLTSALILCFLRDLDSESAMDTLEEALKQREKFIAVGLDSAEVGNPPSKFEKVFARARAEGLLTVAHAGEEGPPPYVWEALDLLKVSRIDHGVRSLEDEKLTKRLKAEEIPLTVCPLSNVKLKVFKDLKEHNLKKMLDLGLKATINSDDPAYFGGYVLENYNQCRLALSLSDEDLIQLAKNSITASFLPENEKRKHLQVIENQFNLTT